MFKTVRTRTRNVRVRKKGFGQQPIVKAVIQTSHTTGEVRLFYRHPWLVRQTAPNHHASVIMKLAYGSKVAVQTGYTSLTRVGMLKGSVEVYYDERICINGTPLTEEEETAMLMRA